MKNGLSRLEGRVEQLVEGTFARMFSRRLHIHEVAVKLARALEDHLVQTNGHNLVAPDRFAVRLNPRDAEALLQAEPEIAGTLARQLLVAARECGLTLLREPTLTLLADPAVPLRGAEVEAWHAGQSDDTVSMTPVSAPAQSPMPADAFLIVEGERHYPLTRPVVSIGRRLDNQIILDHPKISRAHAQLRLRHGRYVVYDLGSTGGTLVNGVPVQEHTLRPGDVITLAGVALIYGEEELPPQETDGRTRPLPPHVEQP